MHYDQLCFIPVIQDLFKLQTQFSHHFNWLKKKNIIRPIGAEKALHKISHPFMKWREIFLNLLKNIYKKLTVNIMLSGEKL